MPFNLAQRSPRDDCIKNSRKCCSSEKNDFVLHVFQKENSTKMRCQIFCPKRTAQLVNQKCHQKHHYTKIFQKIRECENIMKTSAGPDLSLGGKIEKETSRDILSNTLWEARNAIKPCPAITRG